MNSSSEGFVFLIIVAVIITGIVLSVIQARKRREAFALLAQRLGIRYRSGKDRGLAKHYRFLDRLRKGSRRYCFNILEGSFRDQAIQAFDYHYETYSTNSKGHRQTHHHYLSVFCLKLDRRFPELLISKEGFLSKIAQAVGFDDIDFESHEFSSKFCVRSEDKKFAYDFCHVRMMEYLLDNRDLCIEVDGDTLAIVFQRRLAIEQIEPNLNRLIELRALMPDYLFQAV